MLNFFNAIPLTEELPDFYLIALNIFFLGVTRSYLTSGFHLQLKVAIIYFFPGQMALFSISKKAGGYFLPDTQRTAIKSFSFV